MNLLRYKALTLRNLENHIQKQHIIGLGNNSIEVGITHTYSTELNLTRVRERLAVTLSNSTSNVTFTRTRKFCTHLTNMCIFISSTTMLGKRIPIFYSS